MHYFNTFAKQARQHNLRRKAFDAAFFTESTVSRKVKPETMRTCTLNK